MNITKTEHLALLNLDLTSSFIEMDFIQNKSKIKSFLIALVSSVLSLNHFSVSFK